MTPRLISITARRDPKRLARTHQDERQTMQEHSTSLSRWRSPLGIFMLAAGAVGIYYLLTEHLVHVSQSIPFLFLLACPLMHLFHGHGHHGRHSQGEPADRAEEDARERR
jgi:hypothetical protein